MARASAGRGGTTSDRRALGSCAAGGADNVNETFAAGPVLVTIGVEEDRADARTYLTRIWGLSWERHRPALSAAQEGARMQPLYWCRALTCAVRTFKPEAGRSSSAGMTCENDDSSDESSRDSMPRPRVDRGRRLTWGAALDRFLGKPWKERQHGCTVPRVRQHGRPTAAGENKRERRASVGPCLLFGRLSSGHCSGTVRWWRDGPIRVTVLHC